MLSRAVSPSQRAMNSKWIAREWDQGLLLRVTIPAQRHKEIEQAAAKPSSNCAELKAPLMAGPLLTLISAIWPMGISGPAMIRDENGLLTGYVYVDMAAAIPAKRGRLRSAARGRGVFLWYLVFRSANIAFFNYFNLGLASGDNRFKKIGRASCRERV